MDNIVRQTKDGIELLGNLELLPNFSQPITFTDMKGRKNIGSFSTKVEHALYSIISQKENLVYVMLPAEDLELSSLYKYVTRYVVPYIEKVYSMHREGNLMPLLDLDNLVITYKLNLTGVYIYTKYKVESNV